MGRIRAAFIGVGVFLTTAILVWALVTYEYTSRVSGNCQDWCFPYAYSYDDEGCRCAKAGSTSTHKAWDKPSWR